jgi:hypothetical protein
MPVVRVLHSSPSNMPRIWRNNGLSIVLFVCFVGLLIGQAIAGFRNELHERRDHGRPTVAFTEYVRSFAFLEATAENWESEFLQMAAYVWLTVFLFQKGSAESKDPDKVEAVDREPHPGREGAPAIVRRGGFALSIYKNSLVLALLGLFAISFVLHAVGGAGVYAEEQAEHGEPSHVSIGDYIKTSRFWFESLQNWQSEFLAVLTIVVLSIFLRQHGSPESKPVDAPHRDTGE